jgi:hypothetical protein
MQAIDVSGISSPKIATGRMILPGTPGGSCSTIPTTVTIPGHREEVLHEILNCLKYWSFSLPYDSGCPLPPWFYGSGYHDTSEKHDKQILRRMDKGVVRQTNSIAMHIFYYVYAFSFAQGVPPMQYIVSSIELFTHPPKETSVSSKWKT